MNYVANEVVKILHQMKRNIEGYKPKYPDSEPLKVGLSVSKLACAQEQFVHPTPIMKNAMIIYGDVKQVKDEKGEWHTERFPATGDLGKAASTLMDILKVAMERDLHPEVHDYPTGVPITDPAYYYVDCWNFYDELGKKFWDIQPTQLEQLKEGYRIYSDPKTNLSLDDTIKLLNKSPELQKAVEIESRMWPSTTASRDITAISDPFMSKKSGVSYPDYHNDSKTVPGTNITYGRYEIDIVKKAFKEGGLKGLIKCIYDNNIYTAYTRRQLGKGRTLIAESRRSNLGINLVNGVEMENVKNTPVVQIPFLDEDAFLSELSKMAELCEKNGFYPVNIDASAWDRNLGQGPLVLQDAIRYLLGNGSFTKEIIMARTVCNTKGYLVDGVLGKAHMIYGRQFSGYLDTTLGNSFANRITATSSALKTDKHYAKDVITKMKGYYVITLGDDLLVVLRDRKLIKKFIENETSDFKFIIHGEEKFNEGIFFLQWRVFKDEKGKYIMAYNIPRVFRSMLSKEDAKHLGRGGWTLAYYQQLGKLVRYPKALRICLNILAAFDQYHLSLDLPVSEIIKMVKEEDTTALEGKAKLKTVERMYHSNPNIQGIVEDSNGNVDFDPNYFERVQAALKEVYDPNYLPKLGFSNPDLSIIH